MQSFLNKVGKKAEAAANKAGSKANELLEVGKLKGRISAEKQNIKSAKIGIGEYCYDLFCEDSIENDKIKEFCEKIRNSEVNIEELKKQIEAIRSQSGNAQGGDEDDFDACDDIDADEDIDDIFNDDED